MDGPIAPSAFAKELECDKTLDVLVDAALRVNPNVPRERRLRPPIIWTGFVRQDILQKKPSWARPEDPIPRGEFLGAAGHGRNRFYLSHLELVSDLPNANPSGGGAALRARPADRCEPWSSVDASVTADIARAARSAGVDANLAAVLVVERALIEAEFEVRNMEIRTARLDTRAEEAQVAMELAPPTADYLRALSAHGRNASKLSTTFKLPMRLTDRILNFGVDRLLRPEVLGSAVLWEKAAVLSGQTMSEWAFFTEASID